MCSAKNKSINSDEEHERFISRSYTSKKEFVKRYKELYHGKAEAKELYIIIFSQLEKAVLEDDTDNLKKLNRVIDNLWEIEDELTLKDYYNNYDNPIKSSTLFILACKHNKIKTLEYLLSDDCKILNNLCKCMSALIISPFDKDETSHNAFYYAIRSNNVELLNLLIDKWPHNYFDTHRDELDKILSVCYEELKLKNIQLSNKMEIFVQDKLLNLRFFSNNSEPDHYFKSNFDNIRGRIEFIIQNIESLTTEYLDTEKVGEKIIFIIKNIAKNIFILKQQLKSTYDKLPWEEIEFCLVCFIWCHIKRSELNLFYQNTLNADKIINHLQNFAKILDEVKHNMEGVHINKLSVLPKLKREEVVKTVIRYHSEFEQLYNDYEQIRDVYSLDKINHYISLSLSVDPKEREGQIIITRVLQVIGENLKNTLESPKMSDHKSELLLLALPRKTRQVVTSLRDSLSHAHSLAKRTDLEENKNASYFISIQNDIKKVGEVIADILYNTKIKIMRLLLKKITDSKALEDIEKVAQVLKNVDLDKIFIGNFRTVEQGKLEKLINELNDKIVDKTDYEKELFSLINNMISCKSMKSENMAMNFLAGFAILKNMDIDGNKVDENSIRIMKFSAGKALENMKSEADSNKLKEIAELSMNIYHSIKARINHDSLDDVNKLIYEIFSTAEFLIDDIKWIEAFRDKLNKKYNFVSTKGKGTNVTEKQYLILLEMKLSGLKEILTNRSSNEQLFNKLCVCKKSLLLIEMLVLDIMSILGCLKNYCLNHNILFLDDNTPLLTGRSLRNHIAHDNVLLEVLFPDPSVATILNARLLTEKLEKGRNLGKLIKDDPAELRRRYADNLNIVSTQETMFVALEEGNMNLFTDCIKNGADIHARDINSKNALHFATKGSNLEIMKLILNHNFSLTDKDVNGQTPLHVAAAQGRKNVIELLIIEGANVDDIDNSKRSPLHIAAQKGHKDIVEILLKHIVNVSRHDYSGRSPVHYAIKNNHADVAKVLLLRELDVNKTESTGGLTPLHIAAEYGQLDVVNFLLKNNVNVNTRSEQMAVPLHLAALNGHLDVVNALISKGAEVNAEALDSCTPLCFAAETGREAIVNILLKYGANVNILDKVYNCSPLHVAAKFGHQKVVKILLAHNANANVSSIEGITPLQFAVIGGHLETAETLLNFGVNIHTKDDRHATPLHIATANGNKEITETLIRYGANVNTAAYNNMTPLHIAALKGYIDISDLLLKNKANVNAKDIMNKTPLHNACMSGSIDIVGLLIKNKAEINARSYDGITPLHVAALNGHENVVVHLKESGAEFLTDYITPLHAAVMRGNIGMVKAMIKYKTEIDTTKLPIHMAIRAGHEEIVEFLIQNGADIEAKDKNNLTPLFVAVKSNYKKIVELLIANGANVNADEDNYNPLIIAIFYNYRDIVEILLRSKIDVNFKGKENFTPLHIAAQLGHTHIVNALLTRGADVNAVANNEIAPLYLAANSGFEEIVEILISNGANVNKCSDYGTALHIAAMNGHSNVVNILLANKANANIEDSENRPPLEYAVASCHFNVVKMLLQYRPDINSKSNDYCTILHIACEKDNLEIVKYLIENGSDINAKNAAGSKPIHIAAREGCTNVVKFFLSKGLSIEERGAVNQTLLHYSTLKGSLHMVMFLIEKGADVNAVDDNGQTPLHIAANHGYRNIIEILLSKGAIYNAIDKFYRRPFEIANDKIVCDLLKSIDKLFKAVKSEDILETEKQIKAGACINAKNADSKSLLHLAAWKGYDEIVRILLQNKANPNIADNNGITPLHYVAKFSHFKIVISLLQNGAVYNAVSKNCKTPSDFCVDKKILDVFKLVNKSFNKVKNGNHGVIQDINEITDVGIVKAVMNACNRENQTLIVFATRNNFLKLKELKEVAQTDVSIQIGLALYHFEMGDYQTSLSIFKSAFEKRKEILGPDNPGTLDIQSHIAHVLYKQGLYQEALSILDEIFNKQKDMLGLNYKDTLNTRNSIALVYHRQGKDKEAVNIFQEIYEKQKETLGPDDPDTLNTQFHMALSLDKLGKHEEALSINRFIFEKQKAALGENNIYTVRAENNIAMVLANQGKSEEAFSIYEKVLQKKKMILGIEHSDTLRTMNVMATILVGQGKCNKALTAYNEVWSIQKNVLGENHPETLVSYYNMANVYMLQGKFISALTVYNKCYEKMKLVYGPDHPIPSLISEIVDKINFNYKFVGFNVTDMLQQLQRSVNSSASTGNILMLQHLLKQGADVNDRDSDGRTAIHYAADNGHMDVVDVLLKNGADVTQVTNKGNTALHTAARKGHKDIVEVLLQHVSNDKLYDFINAMTTSSGKTALHVAAENGSVEIVKCLLKHGAVYNIRNKEGKTPMDLTNDQYVKDFLKLAEDLFEYMKNGNFESISKLSTLKSDEFLALINARNIHFNTLLQVAIINKHKDIVNRLLQINREMNQ